MEDLVKVFTEKAGAVSASVYPVSSLEAAFDKAVEICSDKAPLDPQMESPQNDAGDKKIVAAPNLDADSFKALSEKCETAGNMVLVQDDLRRFPGGIDMGVTLMDYGIAETGTLVLNSRSEETRLSTMLSEFHVAILPESKLRETALAMADELEELTRGEGAYTAFITGASRTADIERVLAMGVHGPLELHIMLVKE